MQNPNIDAIRGSLNEAIYDRFASRILNYLLMQIEHQQDAEDLLLEVFIAALGNTMLNSLSPERQFAWLRHVTRNKVIDYYRHHALITFLPLEQAMTTAYHGRTPEQYAEWRESIQILYQAIDRLSPQQQELLRLRYSRELRLAEIGAVIGKSEDAARKFLDRTIDQLQRIYILIEKGDNHDTF